MPTLSDPSSEIRSTPLKVAQKTTPSRRGHPRGRAVLILAGLILAGWGAYLLANRPVQSQKLAALEAVPTSVARVGTLERTLRLTGQTSARSYASIIVARFRGQPGMGRGGLVLTQLAAGGTTVKAGDVVAELDKENMLNTIDDLKANIEQSQLNLERQKAQMALDWQNLEQTLRSAKADLDRATLDYKKAEVLTPIEQEILRLAMEQAEAEYKQQQESLGFKKVSQTAQLRTSEMQLQRQQVRYEQSLNDLKGFTFRAPMDGLVVLQSVERSGGTTAQYAVGDSVNPGRAFMKIVDTSTMQVEARASQSETADLRVGQPVKVTLDAFPALEFPGTIYSVGAMARPNMFESYYVRAVPVNIKIQGQDPRLIPDLSAAAEVQLSREENKVLIPLQAVQTQGAQSFVFIKNGPRFEKRFIEVEARGNIDVAVSGLNSGDVVALATPPQGS